MTTEGQGRAADPVGFGIPVVIDGPVGRAADLSRHGRHAGQSRRGLCQAQGHGQGPVRTRRDLAGLAAAAPSGSSGGGLSDPLGGKLGETLGNLLQQGLGQSLGQGRQGRGLPAPSPARRHRRRTGRVIRRRAAGQPADERRAEAVVQSVSWIALITSSPAALPSRSASPSSSLRTQGPKAAGVRDKNRRSAASLSRWRRVAMSALALTLGSLRVAGTTPNVPRPTPSTRRCKQPHRTNTRQHLPRRDSARVVLKSSARKQRAWGMPGARAPAAARGV